MISDPEIILKLLTQNAGSSAKRIIYRKHDPGIITVYKYIMKRFQKKASEIFESYFDS